MTLPPVLIGPSHQAQHELAEEGTYALPQWIPFVEKVHSDMSQEIDDEILSVNAIYSPDTLSISCTEPITLALSLPETHGIILALDVPSDYPNEAPDIKAVHSLGPNVSKGNGPAILQLARDVVQTVFSPGVPVVFDLIQELCPRVSQLLANQAPSVVLDVPSKPSELAVTETPVAETAAPAWTISEPLTERKSVFVARVVRVDSVSQAEAYLDHLMTTDKRVAKATHNITAWRIAGPGDAVFQDCNDDGETAAGGRLLHLLQTVNVWNLMVVVTRWYGGVHLGPTRFKLINTVARNALEAAGLLA